MFKKIDIDDMGININGEMLSHLRFADDFVMISDGLDKAADALSRLASASRQVGLKINTFKTQFMTNLVPSSNLLVEGKDIQQVTSYKYLGHEIKIGRDNQTCEMERRVGLSWAAFG